MLLYTINLSPSISKNFKRLFFTISLFLNCRINFFLFFCKIPFSNFKYDYIIYIWHRIKKRVGRKMKSLSRVREKYVFYRGYAWRKPFISTLHLGEDRLFDKTVPNRDMRKAKKRDLVCKYLYNSSWTFNFVSLFDGFVSTFAQVWPILASTTTSQLLG